MRLAAFLGVAPVEGTVVEVGGPYLLDQHDRDELPRRGTQSLLGDILRGNAG